MRVVAIDTATEVCGLAIRVDDEVRSERRIAQGITHTKVLVQALQALLQESQTPTAAVDGWVVTQGPGSFTGLRIGISTVKGLVIATGKPFVGVSTLAVLAHQAPESATWICPMIDARRHQVYWTLYQRMGGALVQMLPERADSPSEAVALIGDQRPCLFIGNGARLYADAIRSKAGANAFLADDVRHDLQPGVVAELGSRLLAQGILADLQRFAPVYLRGADAQIPSGTRLAPKQRL